MLNAWPSVVPESSARPLNKKQHRICLLKYNKLVSNPVVAQSGSASALGAEGRRFESYQPDHILEAVVSLHVFGFLPFSEH